MTCGHFRGLDSIPSLENAVTARSQEFTGQFTHFGFVFNQQNCLRALQNRGWFPFRFGESNRIQHLRQVNLKRSTPSRRAFHPNESSTLLYNAVNRGQAQTSSLSDLFRGKERLKDVSLRLRVHALPRIADCE